MTAIDFTRWFLALFFLSVAAFYTIRILLLKRRMGMSPVFVGRPGTLHFATHLTFRTFRVVILTVCLIRLLWPTFDQFLVAFDVLWHPTILLPGDALLLASFSAIILLHFYMGKGWRSGIRLDDKIQLLTTGPFAVSQNPMMLCVVMGQVGFFLALPSAFTLICLLAGVWAVVTQVKLEQRLLRERFGAAYDAYAALLLSQRRVYVEQERVPLRDGILTTRSNQRVETALKTPSQPATAMSTPEPIPRNGEDHSPTRTPVSAEISPCRYGRCVEGEGRGPKRGDLPPPCHDPRTPTSVWNSFSSTWLVTATRQKTATVADL